ncbi:hypothetical protein FRB90_008043, partial [Tulasnella sp. 427]
GEWSEQAYLKPLAKLFAHIASHNRSATNDFLKRNADAINTRDHLGRTPLQFALLCSAEEICGDLIEQGGRMTARLVDGRCALHLAAQMGLGGVVNKLLEKSEKNKEEKERKEKEEKEMAKGESGDVEMKDQEDEVRDSSEDDWSSDNEEEDEDYNEAKKKVDPKSEPKGEEDPLGDSEDEPDILDIDAPDWDQCLTALGYAIIGGYLPIVQTLVAAGADCKTPRNLSDSYYNTSTFYPLALTALTPDESVGAQIAEHLVTAGGASCSAADSETVTVFHRLVSLNKPRIVETILKTDSTAKAASRFLYARSWQSALHPIVSAFANGQRAMVAVLLAYAGSRAYVDLETYDRSVAANPNQSGYSYARAGEENWQSNTLQPLEAALSDYNDLYQLVLALEPESVKNAVPRGAYQYKNTDSLRRSMLDFLRSAVREMKRRSRKPQAGEDAGDSSGGVSSNWRSIFDLSEMEISERKGWDAEAIAWEKKTKEIGEQVANASSGGSNLNDTEKAEAETRAQAAKLLLYFQQALDELEKAGARTWDQMYKDMPSEWKKEYGEQDFDPDDPDAPPHTSNASVRRLRRSRTTTSTSSATTPSEELDAEIKPFKRYSLFISGWGEDYPGTHLIPLYDELYEACWTGDNDKIRALCLPPKDETAVPASGVRDLLQITVRVKYTDQLSNYSKGYTPLFVALRARKWDTARLILQIAQEQLAKEEDEEDNRKTANRGGNVIKFDDSDDEDDDSDGDSCDSDETEKRPAG